uniref:Uncharacterized protein n=1 Tax=Castor canadensis TaxID=51338 RepID=A0A8C0X0J6_CASCN
MHALDDVTAVIEHAADVLGVHSAGEVRVAVVAPISTSSAHQKLISDEVLGPGHAWVLSGLRSRFLHTILRSSVASKFWKVVLNLRFSSKDFLSEQILLVEEQNHRDGTQPSNALEEVQSLLQAVGLVVLPNDHVVAAAGHHEDDGSHIFPTIEALDPLAAFIALAAHIEHAVDFVHLELGLKDSRGQDTASKQVLKQVGLLDDINLVQEAENKINQLVLIGALIAGTHSFILPQSLGGVAYRWEVKVRHVHHTQNVVHSELVLRVGQLHRGHQVAHGGHNGLGTYFNGLLQVVFDVLHFGGLLTTVGLKRKRKSYCTLPTSVIKISR